MALKTYEEILNDARNNKYAVPCFNVVNIETLSACIESAEKLKAPLIIAIAQVHLPFIDMEKLFQ
jgi:fructose/tagatose bisphosphate aldolase